MRLAGRRLCEQVVLKVSPRKTRNARLAKGSQDAGADAVKPIVFDLFCGLFGWGEAFAQEGWRVIGFDIEDQFKNFGKQMPDNCELVLRDIRSINGAELVEQYGIPACIVASPPCQTFSWMAMPWTKAKEHMRKILADPAEQTRLTDLFNQCFRIQREVSAAAGHHVPLVVENVRGAQRWVGKARWNCGPYYFWADVPALMPYFSKGKGFQGFKGFKDFHDCEAARKWSSKDPRRKAWSAQIAKIPPEIAGHIAKTFYPCGEIYGNEASMAGKETGGVAG